MSSKSGETGNIQAALRDAISFFSEPMGFIGDQIHHKRVTNAINALLDAKNICEKNNIKIKPVPNKFLIDWVEGASKENDESLSAMWAKLLASASEDDEWARISYTDTLRKLNKKDAEILKHLALDTSPDYSVHYNHLKNTRKFESKIESIITRLASEGKIKNLSELMQACDGIALQFNIILISFKVGESIPTHTKYYQENHRSISILEQERLISIEQDIIFKSPFTSEPISISIFELTKYGFDFIWACEE